MRYQGSVIADKALEHGDVVAICDVDEQIGKKAVEHYGGKADFYVDHRKLLERKDIDVITIGTPDHWHTPITLDAVRAGKDVYVEKPLTLTVDEGKLLIKAIRETKQIVQVGAWQRSDENFRVGIEMVRAGRIGKLQSVEVILGKNVVGGPFEVKEPPVHLHWDRWLGQTPLVPYIAERSHYTFRWWYAYSGGQMTDWGAHNIDIANWGIGFDNNGIIEVEGNAKFPNVNNGYDVAIDYSAKYTYPNGLVMTVLDNGRNGVMFTGTEGRIFVNRGTVSGKPIEERASKPFDREDYKLYENDNFDRPPRTGKLDAIINHMGNFFDCCRSRNQPIASVLEEQHSSCLCHIGTIAQRLGRKLKWDAKDECFVDDAEANSFLKREQRKGYEFGYSDT
jgi:predicted dehydrogenase